MAKIGLVSCVAKKQGSPSRAEDLYTSALFQNAKAFVQQECQRRFILSAKHGLVRPTKVVAPYEETLNRMPAHERRAWASRVWREFQPLLQAGDEIIILAGARYRRDLVPYLERSGFLVQVPLEGKRIGEQLQWLKTHTA